ncbi:MAG: acyl carrier protein [Lachnospiraceae bacterium]|jgi:Acyl carrier protein|nr:acyl carrier protein [Lachnospiraceae bacterium]MCI8779343.1 acyl carrier protein [Lachnospiraceae bacterium]
MEFEKLQMIISEVLSIEPEDVRMEMSFTDDLGADSLEIFQIMMGIEEVFDVVIEEGSIEQIETVEQALQAIAEAQTEE